MARFKKEAKKPSTEERMLDVWNQHVFLIQRKFPDAGKKLTALRKQFEAKAADKSDTGFIPNEQAAEAIRRLYMDLGASN